MCENKSTLGGHGRVPGVVRAGHFDIRVCVHWLDCEARLKRPLEEVQTWFPVRGWLVQITLIITIIMMITIIIDLVVCIYKLRKTEIRLLWPPFSSSLLPNHRRKDELQWLLCKCCLGLRQISKLPDTAANYPFVFSVDTLFCKYPQSHIYSLVCRLVAAGSK